MSDYEIKVDGTPNTFEGGAVRYNKSKGRFDLIPMNVNRKLIEYVERVGDDGHKITKIELFKALSRTDSDKYVELIRLIALHRYGKQDSTFVEVYPMMMLDLAIHFQKGAEKYGEHNCEQGIPMWSFIDSGTRHLMQYANGNTDEPHHISAIWNFWMAQWSLIMDMGE